MKFLVYFGLLIFVPMICNAQQLTIFRDDFSDNKNEWKEKDDSIFLNVRAGSYTFEQKREKKGWFTWRTIKLDPQSDYSISCSTLWVRGTQDTGYGIVFGASDGNNAYVFNLTQNGSYVFGRWTSGRWQSLIPWTKSSLIKAQGPNEIKVLKKGSILEFYINGSYVNKYNSFLLFGDYFGFHVQDQQRIIFDDYLVTSDKDGLSIQPKDFNDPKNQVKPLNTGFLQKELVFYDNYNDNTNKWPASADDSVSFKVENGYLDFNLKKVVGNWGVWKTILVDYSKDFSISCSTKWLGGVTNNGYGLIWGGADALNRFCYTISGNGSYMVYKNFLGKIETIIPWTASEYINKQGANELYIARRGTTLEFYINGKRVNQMLYPGIYGELTGFIINYRQDISFDDLKIAYIEDSGSESYGKIFANSAGGSDNMKTTMLSENDNDQFVTKLPPILTIQDIVLSKSLLNAGESTNLTVTLKNIGPGDANDVYLNLQTDQTGLVVPAKTMVPVIPKNGGSQTVNIELKGGLDLPSAEAILKIEAVEPNFKVKIQGKQVKFPTREFAKPSLLLAKFAVVENLSANPNNQIDINEQIDVKFAIQNIGSGNADGVDISVTNKQPGVMLLGVVDNAGSLVRRNPSYSSIQSGKFETITYRYFINSEFTGNQLTFQIAANEKYGKFGTSEAKSVEINKVLQEEGFIRAIASNDEPVRGKVVIEDIPDFASDVDQDIPSNTQINDKTFAVVIGNENYAKEVKVRFALNDARIFRQYLQKTLGLPANNINYTENATFGQMLDALKWINDVIKAFQGQAKVIFYYAGHGMPDEQTKSPYLLPVDGNSQNTGTAVRVSDIYAKLTEFPSAYVTVFLDACFSGSTRESNETMLSQARGVKIVPKSDALQGNLVVFSAATGDETALPYSDKQHGMLTYFLLKKIQETKGNVTLQDLGNFISTSVSQQSVVVNRKSQTPQVIASPKIQNNWQSIKLK